MSEQEIQNILQENTALRSKVAVLEEELALVHQQMKWLKKQVFGRKTEQISVIMDGGTQLAMFPEEAVHDTASEKKETITVPEHKRKKKRIHEDWMSHLPIEEIVHEEEHPVCEICGSEMQEIGKEKAYAELVYTPAKMYVRRHIIKKYKCPECGKNPENDEKYENDIRDVRKLQTLC